LPAETAKAVHPAQSAARRTAPHVRGDRRIKQGFALAGHLDARMTSCPPPCLST
jgi:hypothetical protein